MKRTDKKKNKEIAIGEFICDFIITLIPTLWFSWIKQLVEQFIQFKYFSLDVIVIGIVAVCLAIKNNIFNNEATQAKTIIKLKEAYDSECAARIMYEKLFSKALETTNSKFEVITKFINNIDEENIANIPKIFTEPKLQICTMLKQIKSSTSDFIGIDEKYLQITSAAKILNSDWEWIDGFKSPSHLTIPDLLNESSSTFNAVLKSNYVCFNSRQEAYKQHKYFEYVDDVSQITDGIIIAKHYFVIFHEKTFAEIVIFLSTKRNFIKEYSEKTPDLLDKYIFDQYKNRMQIELSLLVLEKLNKNTT